jgi:DNA-binding MarR family transcriptional regulator
MARITTDPLLAMADPATKPTRFDERLSFLIHRLHARLAQEAGKLFRAHDLDPVSSRILVLLMGRGEMRVGELVEALILPQSTVSHQLRRLDAAGLIARNRPLEDNRSVIVSLTPRGAAVAAECDTLSRVVHDRMVSSLTDGERATLRLLLLRVFETLDDMRTPLSDDDPPAAL